MVKSLLLVVGLFFVKLQTSQSFTTCNLTDMRQMASDACEMLFDKKSNHFLKKRAISNDIDDIIDNHIDTGDHVRLPPVRVHRRDFPHNGYLIIDHHYAKVLTRMQTEPPYRILQTKPHHKKFIEHHANMMNRQKRGGSLEEDSTSISYCCTHHCEMAELCRRS